VAGAPAEVVAAGTIGVAAAAVEAAGVATAEVATALVVPVAVATTQVAPVVPVVAGPEVRVSLAARRPANRRVAHPGVRPGSSVRAIGPATSTAAVLMRPMRACPTVVSRTVGCRIGGARTVGAPTADVRTVGGRTVVGRIVADRAADRPIATSAPRRRPVCRNGPTSPDCPPRSTPGDCPVG
jgi:hypothetical protein